MEIFECQDHREFLQRYLGRSRPGLGLRSLARRAGFKSPGHLTMLIKGQRRLTRQSAERLAKGMSLRGRGRSLLYAFSQLDCASSEEEKNSVRESIFRLRSSRPEAQLGAKQFSFLAVWYYPVIYALLHDPEASQEPAVLAARIGRGITAAQTLSAITDLEAIQLIQRGEDGRWAPLNTAVTTPEEVRSLAVAKYHHNSVKLAEEALALPVEEREFNGLTVTIPASMVPKVREKIRALRSELNEMLGAESGPAEAYQINLQMFPLTRGREKGDL